MKQFAATLLALFPLISPKALAGELADSYLADTQKLITSLKEAGVEELGCPKSMRTLGSKIKCISTQGLQETLSAIEFVETDEFKKPGAATRWTAFYSPSEKKIYLNSQDHHETFLRGYVGLHELIGLSGGADTEFENTMAIFLFRQGEISAKELKAQLNARASEAHSPLSRANETLATEGGGGTIFGGGGDASALYQRLLFQSYFIRSLRAEGIPKAFLAPIEISDSTDGIQYTLGANGQEPIHILVPRRLTLIAPIRDKSAPNRALEEIGLFYYNLGTSYCSWICATAWFPQWKKLGALE